VAAGKRKAVVTADDAYLRESIVDPGAKVAEGYEAVMPSYRSLSPAEVDALVAAVREAR
jgi:cytochrome c oxidase subunit 2